MDQFLSQLQSPPLRGGGASEKSSAVNEAYINGVYDGLNYRSFLSKGADSLFAPNGVVLSPDAPPFTFFPEPAVFSSHHREKLPSLVSLEAASPEPNRRFGNVRAQQKRGRKRQRLSERASVLQKLLPVDKKMDTATALEEAHKYIRFLEAQVSVLRSMPERNGESGSGDRENAAAESGGDLGRLNRQQVLQVFVNSPAAQKWLVANGCCVYSAEQMRCLRRTLPGRRTYGSNPNSLFSGH